MALDVSIPPAGPAVIVVLESDRRLVGHYGVQPHEFWISGRRTTVGFAVGTMVPPATAKRKGLGRNGKVGLRDLPRAKVSWLYAFPNDAAHEKCGTAHCWIGKRCPRSSNGMGHGRKPMTNPSDAVQRWQHFPGTEFRRVFKPRGWHFTRRH